MPISRTNRPLYTLVCSTETCDIVATHDDGMPWHFESRDSAAGWAHDNNWDGPWCLNDGIPTHCPDCARQAAEKKAREESDREHHQAEITAAINYALDSRSL